MKPKTAPTSVVKLTARKITDKNRKAFEELAKEYRKKAREEK